MGLGAIFSQDIGIDQVFMSDDRTLERIVDLAEIGKADSILEIGTGTGNLTRLLAKRAKRVITIEIDERLKPVLEEKFRGKNVQFIWGNALRVLGERKLKYDKLVSNPPYAICEPLICEPLGSASEKDKS